MLWWATRSSVAPQRTHDAPALTMAERVRQEARFGSGASIRPDFSRPARRPASLRDGRILRVDSAAMDWEGIDLKRWLGISAAIAATVFGLGLLLVGGSDSEGVQTASADSGKGELPGLPWDAAPAETTAPVAEPEPVAKGGSKSMPPASAGNNGSYTPRPASEREQLQALQNPGATGSNNSILLGDTAIAPFSAPAEIQAAISAANQINDQPYRWGGGHAGWRSRGYDCSGAVSYALAGGGLINRPATSGELMHWGEPGRGKWLTVYANAGHTYAVIAGLRWDTAGNASGEGPRWHPANAYPSGYVARHIPGL